MQRLVDELFTLSLAEVNGLDLDLHLVDVSRVIRRRVKAMGLLPYVDESALEKLRGACGAGVALTTAGVFIIRADWGSFWPWAPPGVNANRFSDGMRLVPSLPPGSIGVVVAAVLGRWDVTCRDVL